MSGCGDNPCGLAGLGLSGEGPVAVSLGTSDTVMGITKEPRPQEEVVETLGGRRHVVGGKQKFKNSIMDPSSL